MRWCAHWILTFRDLHDGVCCMVNVLRSLGVSAGDRVMLLAKEPGLRTERIGPFAKQVFEE